MKVTHYHARHKNGEYAARRYHNAAAAARANIKAGHPDAILLVWLDGGCPICQ